MMEQEIICKEQIRYTKLSLEDKCLITLIKLRLGFLFAELS